MGWKREEEEEEEEEREEREGICLRRRVAFMIRFGLLGTR
jgi:hypothetical protein